MNIFPVAVRNSARVHNLTGNFPKINHLKRKEKEQ